MHLNMRKTCFRYSSVLALAGLGLASPAVLAQGTQPYVGQMLYVAFNFTPNNWLPCDGQLLPIAQYETLFVLVGTTYGGDGQTTFAVPDMRGRVPIHQGQGPGLSPYVLGQSSGRESATLTTSTMPSHSHTFNFSGPLPGASVVANLATPAGHALGNTGRSLGYSTTAPDVALDSVTVTTTGTTGSAGGSSQPFGILPPYLVVNCIISPFGVFPSQS